LAICHTAMATSMRMSTTMVTSRKSIRR
jgi:hypothetical protein